MKDYEGKIQYKGRDYRLVFNLNVMETIQEKYGSIDEWGKLTDGQNEENEPNAKAVKFGFTAMLNEGIDMDNEENGTDIKPFTEKQVGRIITEIGLKEATQNLNDTVINSVENTEKNA